MKIKVITLLIVVQLFVYIANRARVDYGVKISKKHEDKTNKLTPLVVSVSTGDQKDKIKGVDLIFVVDTSGSMGGDRITLVKQSLNYVANLMDDTDNMALIRFDNNAYLINGLTQMTPQNKVKIINNINSLRAYGGTNIYAGLEIGLKQIIKDYSNAERICSIVLLSDGQDG